MKDLKTHIMSTVYKTSNGTYYIIDHADHLPAGHGHKTIRVYVMTGLNGIDEEAKEFQSTTNNMSDFDDANDLDGQERYEALYSLVKSNIDHKIEDWIYNLKK